MIGLTVWVSVVNLQVPTVGSNEFGKIVHFEAARSATAAVPTRSIVPRLGPRALQYTEGERESEPEVGLIHQTVHNGATRSRFAENQSLSVISPDHLIELPGTPPPALRL